MWQAAICARRSPSEDSGFFLRQEIADGAAREAVHVAQFLSDHLLRH
jgi:hypothetical protein